MVFQRQVVYNQLVNHSAFINTHGVYWIFILSAVEMINTQLFNERSALNPDKWEMTVFISHMRLLYRQSLGF